MVRFLRTPDYDTLFSGDPIWATEAMAGMGLDGRTLVTKTTFRYSPGQYGFGSGEYDHPLVCSCQFKQYAAKVSIICPV